jgi:hypothetical protein
LKRGNSCCPARKLKYDFLDLTHQGLAVVRLGQEPALAWYHLSADSMAGGENDSDPRPELANTLGETQAIKGTRHLNIGKDDAHLRVGFKQAQRFVGIAGLQNIKAGLFQKVDAEQTHKWFILDNEDDITRVLARV